MSHFKILIVLFLITLLAFCKADEENNLLTKLDCKPGEKRTFNYESNTQLWGPLEENFIVTAEVIVHCLGNDNEKYGTNGLKYMVEIKKLKPTVIKEKQNEVRSHKRTKRGVGSWFKQAWTDVKDFFVNMFSKRRSTENEFDFDIEKQPSTVQYQCRGTKDSKREKRSTDLKSESIIYDKMFSTPFVFIQLMDGSIPEVRFSDMETDLTVKNFKRHIADTFATQLDASKQKVLEQSPIGAHFSRYSYDNSGKLEDSLQPNADGSTLKLGGAFIPMSLQSGKFTPKPLSIMRDVTPDDMMELGNGNGIVYDPSQIDINAKQIQQISEGQLTTTAGHLSLSLISKISRPKRNTDENKDIEEYLKVRTKYSLSMTKKLSKRSSDNSDQMKKLREMESKLNFKSETIVSQSSAETSLREKLITTKKHLNDIVGKDNFYNELLKYSYDHQSPIYNTLMKALNLEVFLNDDTSHSSITNTIQRMGSVKKLNDVCGENLLISNQKCRDLLLMLIKAQSNTAQTKLLKSLNEKTSIEDKSEILKLLVQLPKPSNSLITELLNQVRAQTTDTNYEGILLLAISNLAYHSKSVVLKDQISKFLIEKLKKTQCTLDSDNSLIDLLEAIGNLGHNSTIPYSIELGETCFESDSIRIAAIHSCRRMISSPEIQKWFLKMIKEPKTNCMIKQEVVNTLIEDINAIEMNFGAINRWPKIEFNEIDNILSENLIRIKHNECLQESIVRYFERKNDEHAKAVLKKVKKIRSKREVFNSFWTEAHCKEWVPQNDKKDESSNSDGTVVISDKLRESEEVESNVPYRKRRKCSASRRFGPNQAQAVFRADIVNDFSGPDDKPEYKLMAQFAVGTHFLGKDIDIGKMYVYHRKDSSRAYVNMFGNTLVDAAKSSCDETTIQPYVYSNYFPLYDFNIWIVQMTLGIRLTGEMNFDLPKFNCDSKKSKQIEPIKLSPEARVRAAGEVSGKVLVIKGGMNIGGDFNYFSNLEFEPNPELCLSVYNGYKPMNVSIASWYQFWHPSCSEWMDRTIWSPKSLNWQINDQHRSAWLQNECLLKDSKISKHIEP